MPRWSLGNIYRYVKRSATKVGNFFLSDEQVIQKQLQRTHALLQISERVLKQYETKIVSAQIALRGLNEAIQPNTRVILGMLVCCFVKTL